MGWHKQHFLALRKNKIFIYFNLGNEKLWNGSKCSSRDYIHYATLIYLIILLIVDHCLCIRIMFSWITILKHLITMLLWNTFQSTNITYFIFCWFNNLFKHKCLCKEWYYDCIWSLYNITSHEAFITLGAEHIVAIFNGNTKKGIHVIIVFKPPKLLLSTFVIRLQKF